jgi:hypothetical protein
MDGWGYMIADLAKVEKDIGETSLRFPVDRDGALAGVNSSRAASEVRS